MPLAKVDICNMALGFIGTRMIANVAENSPEAIQCDLYWDRARRTVLKDARFPFALRRESLTLREQDVPQAYSQIWNKCYVAPSGFIKVVSVHAGASSERSPFEIIYYSSVALVLCDVEYAQATYVYDEDVLTTWDEQFVMAMARQLALLLGTSLLKNNPEKIKELAALYESSLPKERWGSEGWAVTVDSLKLNIYNQALGLAGAKPVASLTENSAEAVQCTVYWDRARRSVLRDCPFPFAIRTAGLTSTAMPSVHGGSWTNAYIYPSAALRVLSVHKPSEVEDRQPFAVEYLDSGAKILCNLSAADVTYITDVPDVTLWDEKFTTSMAFKLALLINSALNRDTEDGGMKRVEALAKLYSASLPSEAWKDEQWAVTGGTVQLNIFNRALGLAGAKTVSSVTENTPEAVQCSLYWDSARRSVLRDWPFRFAIHRAALVPLASMPEVYGGSWTKGYEYPADALRVLSVHDPTDTEMRQPFSVEYGESSTAILCNVDDAHVTYVADVTDTSLWDERFTNSMSLKLALFVCNALLPEEKGSKRLEELSQLYAASLPGEIWKDEQWAVFSNTAKLTVYNRALGFVGAPMVSSTTENTPGAVQCSLNWDNARRSVLRDWPFRFAVHRAALATAVMPSVYGGEWTACYQYPADALRVLSVHDPDDREGRKPFSVEYLSDKTVILCNVADAECTYVADVEDTDLWDEKFLTSISYRLAMMICNALLPDEKGAKRLEELSQLYVASLPGEIWEDERWMSGDDETRLRIYNMALGFLDARTISSVTENTPEAVACNIYWDSARMAALRDYPRNFAKRRFLLEDVEMPELYRRQWRHCYRVPEGVLKIVRVHDGIDRNSRCFPFTVEGTDEGEIILCNICRAQATCAIDVPDISKWDSLFVKAMAEMLAIMLYPKLKKRGGRYEHQ